MYLFQLTVHKKLHYLDMISTGKFLMIQITLLIKE